MKIEQAERLMAQGKKMRRAAWREKGYYACFRDLGGVIFIYDKHGNLCREHLDFILADDWEEAI